MRQDVSLVLGIDCGLCLQELENFISQKEVSHRWRDALELTIEKCVRLLLNPQFYKEV